MYEKLQYVDLMKRLYDLKMVIDNLYGFYPTFRSAFPLE